MNVGDEKTVDEDEVEEDDKEFKMMEIKGKK